MSRAETSDVGGIIDINFDTCWMPNENTNFEYSSTYSYKFHGNSLISFDEKYLSNAVSNDFFLVIISLS